MKRSDYLIVEGLAQHPTTLTFIGMNKPKTPPKTACQKKNDERPGAARQLASTEPPEQKD
jgi:hypothetical protein